MPEMKNLDNLRAFLYMVIDEHGRIHKLANAFPPSYWATNVRESLQELNVVEDGCPKLFSRFWVVCTNVIENGFQVV